MATSNVQLVIFGGTGDLTTRMLMPSLLGLFDTGKLANFAVLILSNRNFTDDDYREFIRPFLRRSTKPDIPGFLQHIFYQTMDVTKATDYTAAATKSHDIDKQFDLGGNRIFYFAVAPRLFSPIIASLPDSGFLARPGYKRVVIEKPFGQDYPSAKALNEQLNHLFHEDQIFRIDHYLEKRMVQNIMLTRFGNGLTEGIWNSHFIDNVQVTLSETVGLENRAGYYDQMGATRDMVQNHIFQLISLLAMDQPISLRQEDVTEAKVAALRMLKTPDLQQVDQQFVLGQYLGNQQEPAYLDEERIPKTSRTETFVAGELNFNSYRWDGVPFYFRTGKRLATKTTRIDVVFKAPQLKLFEEHHQVIDHLAPNILTILIDPDEGLSMQLNTRDSDEETFGSTNAILANTQPATGFETPEAYESLLSDIIDGNTENFPQWREIAVAWQFIDALRAGWQKTSPIIHQYPLGSMGPEQADELLTRTGRYWAFDPTK